jgi:hypothetical protein
MYNQFILEELKTLNDLLAAGAISQGEYDHLKQILIDGTKAGSEAPAVAAVNAESNHTPEDAVKFYVNEVRNLILYNQYDKAYSYLQKVFALRPDHRDAYRLMREVTTRFRKDYFIGALFGVLLACVLSYLLTAGREINFLLLCIIPAAVGMMMPPLANGLFSGRANRPAFRYTLSLLMVAGVALAGNLFFSNGLMRLERKLAGSEAPVVFSGNTKTGPTIHPQDDASTNNGNNRPAETELFEAPSANEAPAATPGPATGKTRSNERTNAPAVASRNVADKESAVRDILKQYYRDYNKKQFDASLYFAPKVDRFITLKNTTPAEITSVIENEFYDEFQEAASSIDMNTLQISKHPNGYYQADFEEIMSCFRKSKGQPQFIRTRVKVIFDRELKIRYNHQERVLETRYGSLKASVDGEGRVLYTNQ